jgi:hypothetical protein
VKTPARGKAAPGFAVDSPARANGAVLWGRHTPTSRWTKAPLGRSPFRISIIIWKFLFRSNRRRRGIASLARPVCQTVYAGLMRRSVGLQSGVETGPADPPNSHESGARQPGATARSSAPAVCRNAAAAGRLPPASARRTPDRPHKGRPSKSSLLPPCRPLFSCRGKRHGAGDRRCRIGSAKGACPQARKTTHASEP